MNRERLFSGNSVFLLLLILLAGLFLRLDFLLASSFRVDADEAIVGLMAKHLAEGRELPLFYYGQHYMGSFEPMVVSVFFRLFGVSEVWLKVTPLLFSLLFIFLTYLISFEIGQSRTQALRAALLCAIAPATLVVWSAKARGGFIELVCIGALAILWTLRWLRSQNISPWELFPIRVILGFGWWTNNQIIYFMLPIGFLVFGRFLGASSGEERGMQGVISGLLMGISGFVLGGLPFWLYNIEHHFASFSQLGSADGSGALSHAEGFFSVALPILLGAKRFWQQIDVFPGFSLLLAFVYGLLFLCIIGVRFHEILSALFFRVSERSGVELLLFLCFAIFCVFSLSSFGYLSAAPRYLLPLYVAIFPLTAYGISLIEQSFQRLARALLFVLLGLNLVSCYLGSRAIPGEPFVYEGERVQKDHAPLIAWLEKEKISWVRTNYWIGYRLAFETQERIRFLIFQEPHQSRISSYLQAAKELDTTTLPLVLVKTQGDIVRTALDVLGYNYKTKEIGGYQVVYDIHPLFGDLVRKEPPPFSVTASSNASTAKNALDGDLNTRWGSGEPQRPGMYLEVRFDEPMTLRGLEYSLSLWPQDFPRRLRVEIDGGDGVFTPILTPREYRALRYYGESDWTIAFSPRTVIAIRFVQLGKDKVFDWSIGELSLYQ